MSDSTKSALAKFAVPLLIGLLPTAFFVGRAYGGDTNRIERLEEESTRTRSDHDTLARIDERVRSISEDVASLRSMRDAVLRILSDRVESRGEK